jgi:hypothetical protein
MRDENFRQDFLNSGKYPLKKSGKDDRMTILVEYMKQEKNGEIETKEISINKIYSFNDTEIAPVPANPPNGEKFSRTDVTPMEELWNTA